MCSITPEADKSIRSKITSSGVPAPVNYASVAIPPAIPDFFSASLGQELIELDQYDAGQHYANLYGEVAKGASDTKIGRPFPRRVSLLADQKAVVEFLEARRLILMRRGSRIEKIVTDAAIFDEVPKDSDLLDLRVGLS